jgi:hypothetical protein
MEAVPAGPPSCRPVPPRPAVPRACVMSMASEGSATMTGAVYVKLLRVK